ncbi:MAG TPA: hypothetical protein VGB92_10370 [Longimicrobium sp.]
MFADLVKGAGFLISATATLSLTWRGRAKWEPSEQDLPRGVQRLGGLLGAIALGILFTQYATAAYQDELIRALIWLATLAVASFVLYGILIKVYTYKKRESKKQGEWDEYNIIGGYWLTAAAREAKAQPVVVAPTRGQHLPTPVPHIQVVTIQDLFEGAAYKEDAVWPRLSRALAQQSFNLAYLGLTVCGTIALSIAAILVILWQASQ